MQETNSELGTPRRSVAILVDDLVAWIGAGHQPTGVPRVVAELLATAYTRADLDVRPSMSFTDLQGNVQLREISRESVRWDARSRSAGASWLLRMARSLLVRVWMPRRVQFLAKSVYTVLSLRARGVRVTPSGRRISLLLVPGAFWLGNIPERTHRLVQDGAALRVIVYDLFPLTHPEWFNQDTREPFAKGLDMIIPLCDRIVTLGNTPARDLVARYPAVASRIRVAVPPLSAHTPRVSASPAAFVPGPYVLVLGTVEPRKNHRVVLDAWHIARRDERLAEGWLVVAGQRGWKTDDIEAEIARHSTQLNIMRMDRLSDAEVEALYAGCRATVHASWAEGFGLPVRESVARGIPTIISSGIPTDGLSSGTFQLFDPSDATELAGLIRTAILRPATLKPIPHNDGTGWEPVLSALID